MTIEEIQVLITARTQGLQNQMNQVMQRLRGVQRQSQMMGQQMSRAFGTIERESTSSFRRVRRNAQEVRRELEETSRSTQSVQRSVTMMSNSTIKTFANLKNAMIALGIGKAIAGAFNLARTYEANVQQVNRMFGLYSGALDAWIEKNAKTFGMARADAMQYASIYGNLVRAFETDSSKMTYYTTELMKATTIVASSTGRTVKDVSERIRSGILGNTEAIEDLGIYAQVAMLKTSNAFKEVANGRTWDQLTFQEQQQIRVLSILEQASNQFGDSIQNNMNYKLMQLTASLKDTWLYLGQAFMPIVNAVLPILNAMAQALANVTAKLAAFMNTLFGTNFHQGTGVDQVGVSANHAASGFGNMADEAKDAGKEAEKAAKKAKAALAPFDELNVLSKNNGESGGGSGGMDGGTGDIGSTLTPVTNTLEQAAESFADKLKAELEKLKALFKQGFEIGLGSNFKDRVNDIKKSIEGIKASLKDIFTDSAVVNGFNNLLASLALNNGKITGSFVSIGTTIAQNLLGGLNKYLDQNKQFIKDRLVGIMDITSEIANLVGNFSVAFADIFSVFGGKTAQQITANIIGMFANGLMGAFEIFMKFTRDITKALTEPFVSNKDLIKTTLEETLKPIESITGTIKDFVTNTFISINKAYDEHVKPAFENITLALTNLMTNLLNNYNTYILPVINGIASKIGELFNNYIQPNVDLMIDAIGRIIEAASRIFLEVIEPIVEDFNNLLGPAIAWINEKISDLAIKLTEDLFTALGNVSDAIADVCTWLAEHKTATEVIITLLGSLAVAIGIVKAAMSAGAIAQAAITAATTAWNVVVGIGTTVTGAFGAAIAAVIAIVVLLIRHWDEVKEAAAKCWDWIVEKWNSAGEWFNTTVVEPIKQFFSALWEGIKTTGSNCWNGIVSVWNAASTWFNKTIIEPVKKAFTGMWDGIKKVCGDTWTTIKNTVKSGINGIIGFINKMINGINSKLSFNLPEFFGGGRIGFEIPNIPPLAKGGVLRQSTIVEVGEYPGAKNNPEIVTPQNIMYDTVVSANAELASSFFQAARMIVSAIENKDSNLIIGDEVIGKSSVNYINKQTKLKGVSPLNL